MIELRNKEVIRYFSSSEPLKLHNKSFIVEMKTPKEIFISWLDEFGTNNKWRFD